MAEGVQMDLLTSDGRVEVIGPTVGRWLQDRPPLESAEKFLSHSFVESPERKNVYDGL
jgi:hypothetical protein